MKEQMTYHCKVQRANRVKQIIDNIGIGQVVVEKYIHTAAQIAEGKPGKYICVTDTGITIIKTEDKQKVITMYVTTQNELVRIYNGVKRVPAYLRKRVDHNQSKFTANGKTVW